jgi:hypothetical protein
MAKNLQLLTKAMALAFAVSLAPMGAIAQDKGHSHSKGEKHAHPTAKHGGVIDDVGEYHAELVVKDGKITIHVLDHDGKDAATDGYKASVLITAGSQKLGPFALQPAGGNKLEGAGAASVPAGSRAILTLVDKGGKSAQARYELK